MNLKISGTDLSLVIIEKGGCKGMSLIISSSMATEAVSGEISMAEAEAAASTSIHN